ncbi:MAG: energy-coupling factor transporter transmembrane component T [Candidatus Poribacteria bacterium]|nr:energy-coupling factor transporter transmembrane component T [Candidatus Poribacteria bacterium]MDE0504987.1 energy-coupling factor transporter transmembrane component T [Candidatus Poribacteria bacterium]
MPISRLDPRTKILILIFIGILVITLDSVTSLLCCFLVGIGLIILSFPTWLQYRLLFLFILFSTWGLIYSQAIFYNASPRTVLFTLVGRDIPIIGTMTGGVHVYREGLLHGAIQSLRFNTTLTIGCFIVWSTQPRDLLLAFVKLRVPYSLAFMVTTSLRYIPLIATESRNVILSQRLRGFRYFQSNPRRVIRDLLNSLRPILINNIRRATHLGETVESRAFSPEMVGKQRTSLRTLNMQPQDKVLLAAGIFAVLGVITLKALYFCYANGIYYAHWMRGVYTFVREIL